MSLPSGPDFSGISATDIHTDITGNKIHFVGVSGHKPELRGNSNGLDLTDIQLYSSNIPTDAANTLTHAIGLDANNRWWKTSKESHGIDGDVTTHSDNTYDSQVKNTFKGEVIIDATDGTQDPKTVQVTATTIDLTASPIDLTGATNITGNTVIVGNTNTTSLTTGDILGTGNCVVANEMTCSHHVSGTSDDAVTTAPKVIIGTLQQGDAASAGIKLRNNVNSGAAGNLSVAAGGEMICGQAYAHVVDATGTGSYSLLEVDDGDNKIYKRNDFHSGNLARLNHNHHFSGNMTHGGTNDFQSDTTLSGLNASSMLELDANKKVVSTSGFSSGNLARINADHTISGNWTLSGENTYSGDSTFSGDMTHTGTNTYSGDSTFGNNQGSGGVGKTIHYGQVFFEDTSISGDTALVTETLCRTATNKLQKYNPLTTNYLWTGTHGFSNDVTLSGLTASTMLELDANKNIITTSGFSSGNIARLNVNSSYSGNMTHLGTNTFSNTVNMSALTASLPLTLDANKNIVSGSAGIAVGDNLAWTGTNSYSATSTHTNDIIMTTGNLDIEDGDLWVAGTFQVDGNSSINGELIKSKGDAPASASASGNEGEIRWDESGQTHYLYLCVATDTWTRVEMTGWQ